MEENKTIKYIGVILLIVLFGIGGFFLGKKTAQTENILIDNNNSRESNSKLNNNEENNQELEDNEPITNDNQTSQETVIYDKVYQSYYGTDENGTKLYHNLVLRSDNTFYLYISDMGNGTRQTGTYTITDGIITLKETARYSSSNCYYTNSLKTYTGTIKDGNLTINLEVQNPSNSSETIKSDYLFTNTNNDEKQIDKAWYSAYPKNGVTPSGSGETWKDCTN